MKIEDLKKGDIVKVNRDIGWSECFIDILDVYDWNFTFDRLDKCEHSPFNKETVNCIVVKEIERKFQEYELERI